MVQWSMHSGHRHPLFSSRSPEKPRSNTRLVQKLLMVCFFAGSLSITPSYAQSFDPDKAPQPVTDDKTSPSGEPLKLPNGTQTNIRPQDVVSWEGFDATEQENFSVVVQFRLNLKNSWKIYASNLKFEGPPGFTLDKISPPKSKKFMDPISNKEVDVYEGGEFEAVFTGAPRWTDPKFPISLTYVGCTDVICLFPFSQALELPFRTYLPATSASQEAAVLSNSKTGDSPPQSPEQATNTPPQETRLPSSKVDAPVLSQQMGAPTKSDSGWEATLAQIFGDEKKQASFMLLLGVVFLGGLLSNLTPCVYPMIPITLRVLARQVHRPHLGAAAYTLGIILTYTSLGLVAALSGGLFGSMLASKSLNIGFSILMALLGLGMIGFGNFSKIQMVGQKFGSGTPSFYNAFAMGIGAGFVAAPCTGPILAALLAYTAKQESSLFESTALLFTYSFGFGLPYMILGGAAAKVSKTKVPPMVQVGVKLVFASVMFALSLYYLRIPLYSWVETMRGSWHPIAVTATLLGILAVGLWLSISKLSSNKFASIIPATLLGVGIFASSQWLTEASTSGQKLHWYRNESEAFEQAKKQGKNVLIDMWAEWCEACKKMDATTFQDPFIIAEIEKNWIPLKIDLTELDETNEKIQAHYNIQSLPTLVLSGPQKDPANYKNIGGFVHAADLMEHLSDYLKRHQP